MRSELDGKRFCYYLTDMMGIKHADGTTHFYPAIVIEGESEYQTTDLDFGTDFTAARDAVVRLNTRGGISQVEATEIVTSSMFPNVKRKRGSELSL